MNEPQTESPYRTREAVCALVTDNLNLARYFALKWTRSYGDHDALSDAMQALWRAAREWDERIPFGSYASCMLRWRMPLRLQAMNRICRGGGVPNVSLDAHGRLGDGGESYNELMEFVADEQAETPGSGVTDTDRERIAELLEGLTPRQREVVERRFGLNGNAGRCETLWDIADTFGVTNERVRQIEQEALGLLRERVRKSESMA